MRARSVIALLAVAACYMGCTLIGGGILDDKPRETDAAGGDGASGAAGGSGGGGTPADCVTHADCPGLDTTCRYRICDDGSCGFGNAPERTSCSEDGGQLCDGNGGCVECLDAQDCGPGDSCVMNQCVPPHCVDGARGNGETDIDCGGGDCVPCKNGDDCLVPLDCASKFCDAGTCAACSDSGDCAGVPDSYCANDGVCRPQKAVGADCNGADECLSGHCPADDGLCCDTACNANCEACLMIKSGAPNGSCDLVGAGQAFDGDCADQGAASCGASGDGCDGNGACILYDASTECAPGGCTGSTLTPPSLCDGNGSCVAPTTTTSCAPYTCNSSGACRTSCSTAGHCTSGGYCAGNAACMTCGSSPAPPGGGCPPVCTGGCPGNQICLIDCTPGTCNGATITCPPNFHCQIDCLNNDDCGSAVILCPASHRCELNCSGNNACNGTDLNCGDASCSIDCAAGVNVCNGAAVSCGAGACRATCSSASKPSLMCNDACECTPCP